MRETSRVPLEYERVRKEEGQAWGRLIRVFAALVVTHLALVMMVPIVATRGRLWTRLLFPFLWTPAVRSMLRALDGVHAWLPILLNSVLCAVVGTGLAEGYVRLRRWRWRLRAADVTARARAPLWAISACFAVTLPLALALALDGPERPVVRANELGAAAHIRRGNAAGEFHIPAYGAMRDGRPRFDRVSVSFYRPSGRMLLVNSEAMTFAPLANRVSSADYQPVTAPAILKHLSSIGCDVTTPEAKELADAIREELGRVSKGTLPEKQLWVGPRAPPPEDGVAFRVVGIFESWFVLSGLAALWVVGVERRIVAARSVGA
jgi:hypothetical protein